MIPSTPCHPRAPCTGLRNKTSALALSVYCVYLGTVIFTSQDLVETSNVSQLSLPVISGFRMDPKQTEFEVLPADIKFAVGTSVMIKGFPETIPASQYNGRTGKITAVLDKKKESDLQKYRVDFDIVNQGEPTTFLNLSGKYLQVQGIQQQEVDEVTEQMERLKTDSQEGEKGDNDKDELAVGTSVMIKGFPEMNPASQYNGRTGKITALIDKKKESDSQKYRVDFDIVNQGEPTTFLNLSEKYLQVQGIQQQEVDEVTEQLDRLKTDSQAGEKGDNDKDELAVGTSVMIKGFPETIPASQYNGRTGKITALIDKKKESDLQKYRVDFDIVNQGEPTTFLNLSEKYLKVQGIQQQEVDEVTEQLDRLKTDSQEGEKAENDKDELEVGTRVVIDGFQGSNRYNKRTGKIAALLDKKKESDLQKYRVDLDIVNQGEPTFLNLSEKYLQVQGRIEGQEVDVRASNSKSNSKSPIEASRIAMKTVKEMAGVILLGRVKDGVKDSGKESDGTSGKDGKTAQSEVFTQALSQPLSQTEEHSLDQILNKFLQVEREKVKKTSVQVFHPIRKQKFNLIDLVGEAARLDSEDDLNLVVSCLDSNVIQGGENAAVVDVIQGASAVRHLLLKFLVKKVQQLFSPPIVVPDSSKGNNWWDFLGIMYNEKFGPSQKELIAVGENGYKAGDVILEELASMEYFINGNGELTEVKTLDGSYGESGGDWEQRVFELYGPASQTGVLQPYPPGQYKSMEEIWRFNQYCEAGSGVITEDLMERMLKGKLSKEEEARVEEMTMEVLLQQLEGKWRHIYALASFVNHSCDPNAEWRIDAESGKTPKYILTARRPIKKGEPITTSYTGPAVYSQNRALRLEGLRSSLGQKDFECLCEKCEKEVKEEKERKALEVQRGEEWRNQQAQELELIKTKLVKELESSSLKPALNAVKEMAQNLKRNAHVEGKDKYRAALIPVLREFIGVTFPSYTRPENNNFLNLLKVARVVEKIMKISMISDNMISDNMISEVQESKQDSKQDSKQNSSKFQSALQTITNFKISDYGDLGIMSELASALDDNFHGLFTNPIVKIGGSSDSGNNRMHWSEFLDIRFAEDQFGVGQRELVASKKGGYKKDEILLEEQATMTYSTNPKTGKSQIEWINPIDGNEKMQGQMWQKRIFELYGPAIGAEVFMNPSLKGKKTMSAIWQYNEFTPPLDLEASLKSGEITITKEKLAEYKSKGDINSSGQIVSDDLKREMLRQASARVQIKHLYALTAFANHSCNPNTEWKIVFVPAPGDQKDKIPTMVLTALRPIKQGEAVTVSYIGCRGLAEATKAQRLGLLRDALGMAENWECLCERCEKEK